MKKRLLSLALSICMLTSTMPVSAYAGQTSASEKASTTQTTISVSETANDNDDSGSSKDSGTSNLSADTAVAPETSELETSAPETATSVPETAESESIVQETAILETEMLDKTGSEVEASEACTHGATAERCELCQLQKIIDTLPSVAELAEMTEEEQNEAYNVLQQAYDAWHALSDQDKEGITGTDIFETLFVWFNGQIVVTAASGVTAEVTGDYTYAIYANGNPLLIVGTSNTYAKIYIDSNKNGIVDSGEEEVTNLTNVDRGVNGYFLTNSTIYGGSKDDTYTGDTYVTVSGNTYTDYTVQYVYGGNASGVFNGNATVNVEGGYYINVYGGNAAGTFNGNTTVNISGGSYNVVYGGNANGTFKEGNTTVNVTGGSMSWVMGGSQNGTMTGDTKLNINGGTVVNSAYGGCENAELTGNAEITLDGGAVQCVYGGSMFGAINGSTKANMKNGTVRLLFGGSQAAIASISKNTTLNISGGTVNWAYGGSNLGTVTGGAATNMTGGTIVSHLYGGSGSGDIGGSTSVAFTGGSIGYNIYGGNENAGTSIGTISDNTSVVVSGGAVQSVFGGSRNAGKVNGNTNLTFDDGADVKGWVYGGGAGYNDNVITEVGGSTNITVNGGRIYKNIYGGGAWRGATVKDANIIINDGTVSGGIYGGGEEKSNVTGTSKITVNGGKMGDIYGAGGGFGNTAAMVANVEITIKGGAVASITSARGYLYPSAVIGSAIVTLNNTSVFSDAYGIDANNKQVAAACTTKLVLENFGSQDNFFEVGGTYGNNKYPSGNSETGFQNLEIKNSYVKITHPASMLKENFILNSGILWLDASWQDIPSITGEGGTLWVTENLNIHVAETAGEIPATAVSTTGGEPRNAVSMLFQVPDKTNAKAAMTSSNMYRDIRTVEDTTTAIQYNSVAASVRFKKQSEDASMVYGKTVPTFSVEVERIADSGDITYEWLYGYNGPTATPLANSNSSSYTPVIDINSPTGTNPYICKVTCNGVVNYSRVMLLEISKAPLTIVWNNTATYNGNAQLPGYTLDGLVYGIKESDLRFTLSSEAGEMVDADTYTVTAAIGMPWVRTKFEITNPTTTFTIEKAPLTTTISGDTSKVYDGTNVASGLTIDFEGKIGNDNISISADSYTYADKNAGKDKLITANNAKITGDDKDNYKFASESITTTGSITEKPVEVVISGNSSAVYGDVYTHSAAYETVGDDVADVSLQYDNSSTKPVNVKLEDNTVAAYVMTAIINDKNYKLADTTGVEAFTITQAPLKVTADEKSKIYGTNDPDELTYQTEGLRGSDIEETVLTGALSRAEGEAANDYDIEQGTLALTSENYELTYNKAVFTINKADVTLNIDVTPSSQMVGKDVTVSITAINAAANVTGSTADTLVTGARQPALADISLTAPAGLTERTTLHEVSAGHFEAVYTVDLTAAIADADFKVVYNGNDNYNAAADKTATLTVTDKHAVNVTLNADKTTGVVYGDSVTYTVAVNKAQSGDQEALDGTVTFWLGEPDAAGSTKLAEKTIGRDELTVTLDYTKLTAGDHSIYAVYSGNGSYSKGQANITTVIAQKQLAWDVSGLSAEKQFDGSLNMPVAGTLKVSGVVGTDEAGFTYDSISGTVTNSNAGTREVTVVVANAAIANTNYKLPTEAMVINGTIKAVDELPAPTESTEDTQLKLVVTTGISSVPEALKNNASLNTPEKIEAMMKLSIKDIMSDVSEDQLKVFDVALLFSTDGGVTWEKATERNFPKSGITVVIDYESLGQTYEDAQTMKFVITHMFTTGSKAGTTETIYPEKTADGLKFKVYSLSPIAVAYEALPTVTFDAGDGSCDIDSMMVGDDGKLTSLPTATRSGYTFDGWYTEKTNGTKLTVSTVFEADTTVYAQWTKKNTTSETDKNTTTNKDNTASSAKTGDSTPIALLVLLLIVSAGVCVYVVVRRRRRRS